MSSRPSGRPRTQPTEQRRADLMRSAERLFLQKGVEQATIEEIAFGAEISKGAFYLHFSSKADVVEALRARFVDDMLAAIVAEVDRHDDGRARLAAWAKTCAGEYLKSSTLHRLIFAAAPAPPRSGLTRNALIGHLSSLLASGNGENAWSVDDPVFTAVFLFNALHGAVDQASDDDDQARRDALTAKIEDHFQKVVGRAQGAQ